MRPSGTRITPQFFPILALSQIMSATQVVTCDRVICFASTSSPIRTQLIWVLSAHSRAIWEADLPMSLTKWQYSLEEMTSEQRFPIASEQTFVAVSNPNETGMCSFYRSPSMVLGQPMTLVLEPCLEKYSARRQAFVFESSPPMTTRPSRLCLFQQFSKESWNSLSFSILCLPLPTARFINKIERLKDTN